jgi:predicted lipid-binding transport protein (Tim44 family)
VKLLQLITLLVFAALAAAVLYQLYAVLGRRVGRQPEEHPLPTGAPALGDADQRAIDADPRAAPSGLAAIRARDPSFDAGRFLEGARGAYESIVKAFAAGDRTALQKLVAPNVLTNFETAMAEREAEGRTQSVEFTSTPRADIDKIDVTGDVAYARVRFLAELRSRSKGPEGEAVDDQRTAELWTFERKLISKDPNWTLVRVDAAEA